MTDTTAPKTEHKSSLTLVSRQKAEDTSALILSGTEAFPDDTFTGLYTEPSDKGTVAIVSPPFNPGALLALTTTNNTLAQCVDVMQVNIDGTGHTIELIEGETEDDAQKQILVDFFDEPYPGKSMLALRSPLRGDLESTGNGYLEILRNAKAELVLMNQLPSVDMRLCRLDDPVFVTKVVTRKGKPLEVKIRARERRFVQSVNGKRVFFREFGSSRDLDRDTGKWSPAGEIMSIAKRASEIIHFRVMQDAKTPYGVPRWINQLPSVLGSRKAEEFNLDFFDAGGLPPVLVVVQGGYLGSGVKEDLQAHLGGKGGKHRAAIVEAVSSSGSLDSSGTVKVTVERFGAERQQDAMFQTYDKNCEEHIRTAFRFPPMFLGRSSDYNFATALTGYMTAEAQVFAPERMEFDEMMWWVVKALGVTKYVFKSRPLNLTNIEVQLKAIQLLVDKGIVEGEDVVKHLNSILSMALTYKKPEPVPDPLQGAAGPGGTPDASNAGLPPPRGTKPALDPSATTQQTSQKVPSLAEKSEGDVMVRLIDLSVNYAQALGIAGVNSLSESQCKAVKDEVASLDGETRRVFNHLFAQRTLVAVTDGSLGLDELCGALG